MTHDQDVEKKSTVHRTAQSYLDYQTAQVRAREHKDKHLMTVETEMLT